MFAVRTLARPAVATATSLSNAVQVRNMATLKEIQLRLKSVSNISKITKSMKMIASTKVAKAQRAMENARAYGNANNAVFLSAETKPASDSNSIFIAASSDRGLCGGIHSTVAKYTRNAIGGRPDVQVVVLGDKAKAQLSRTHRAAIALSFNQIGKDIPTFAEASAIVDIIKSSGVEFDNAHIVYNKFLSAISYEATAVEAYSEDTFKNSPNFAAFELEDDVLENLQEFTFANNVYWALVEGHAAEMAAKRSAMENATKNAGEMINKLTLTYNRGRQAVITNELIDIITGASAL
ncbi:ATP synthase F1, gamma subunit [Jimgerdemannia flammicorona]|uniref:ATP synthase subunit gamma n=2 Tax=Jimgerdemannia flammicorona TaxID=994334 RepID=A0A433DE59_9FUNG|nr:ATP synthase F1, gamma subunit [Jimgerdemannia flammicorona]RUS35471.1 ATP synthase F1, gamma subunit [Jimgerdemannia flammicorona]